MITKTMVIQGMDDQEAADKVSHALHEVWGVRKVEIHLNRREATFSYDDSAASFLDFEQAVLELGFEVKTENGVTDKSLHEWQLEDVGGNTNAADL